MPLRFSSDMRTVRGLSQKCPNPNISLRTRDATAGPAPGRRVASSVGNTQISVGIQKCALRWFHVPPEQNAPGGSMI